MNSAKSARQARAKAVEAGQALRCRRSDFSRHLWKTSALSTIALAGSGAAYAQDAIWQPQVQTIIGGDQQGAYSSLEGFIPLTQTQEAVVFLDLRLKHDFSEGTGGDVGIGLRRVVNPDLILGGYAYLNVQRLDGHQFTGATLGIEAIATNFDAHVNVHLPFGDQSRETSSSTSSLSFVENALFEQISVLNRRDYASWGVEGEFGVQAPIDLPKDHALRLHVGGYHFEDAGDIADSITGAKAGLEYTIGGVFGDTGASVVLGGEVRHDNRDDTTFAGSVRLTIPLGENAGHGEREPVTTVSEGLRRRANERVRGDIGVRLDTTETRASITRRSRNLAGQEFGLFFFADGENTLGLGTLGDPTTLNDAVAKAGTGFVVALGGKGNLLTTGVTLSNGQTVIGGGQSVQAQLFNGSTRSFALGGSDGTIQGTNPASPVISLGNGNTLQGITVTGGGVGILGNNINGATLTNVTVNGAGSHGASFTGSSTGVNASNFTATGNGGDGLHIEGNGTYSFTGTTLLSGNAGEGLDIFGQGTYAFATLNALNNTGGGIKVVGTSTAGKFSTTGGTVAGNGGTGVFIDPISTDVVLNSISHNGGTSGVVLDRVAGSFTVTGATTISNTTGAGIAISSSPAAIRFGDIAITTPGGDGIKFTGVNAAVVAGNIVISGIGAGDAGFDFSGSNTSFTAQSVNITGTGVAGSTGIDLSGTNGGTIVITNGGAIGGVATGVRLGIAGSLANTANANFTFGGGTIAGSTASLDARGLNPVSGSYAFGSTVFNGPQLFSATNIVFVGAAATGAGDGSSVNDLATIATADGKTAADAVFVLVNGGVSINDADGFTLGAGQTLASFGNGAQYALGGVPLNVTGVNASNFTATGNAGSGLWIASSGTFNFTGTTTLSNNAGLGLSIAGAGNYNFQTLNAQANAGGGVGVTGGTFRTTGGTVSGNGGTGVKLSTVTAGVVFNSITHSGGATGIDLNTVGGSFAVSGATTISNTSGNGIAVTGSAATLTFGAVTIANPGGDGIAFTGINGSATTDAVTITGLGAGDTGLDFSGSRTSFTAHSVSITGTGAAGSRGIDLSGTQSGSVISIGGGSSIANVDTGVRLGISGSFVNTANATFSFGGGSIQGITASLDMRGLLPASGTYAFDATTFTGPQLFDAAEVVFVGATDTGALHDGSDVNNLINAAAADDLGLGPNTIFVLVGTALNQTITTDADGFTLATGQSLVSFANSATVTIGGPPANVTGTNGTNLVAGATQADPFGAGAPTLNNAAGNTIDLSNQNVVSNLIASSSLAAIDGTGISGFVSSGVEIRGAATGLFLDNASGTITIANLNIQGPVQTGIALANTAATINFTGTTTIAGGTNAGLLATNFDGTASFADLDIAGGTGAGIGIFSGSGGTLAFGALSSVTNTGGAAFSVGSSTATVTYNGTITQTTAANAVRINAMTGGSATFGGSITASTGAANAIDLTGNSIATISFNGGLNLTTTSGTAFNAAGGGTINVAATAGAETITSATGRAINLDGVTLGAVSFDSITTTGVTAGTALNFSAVIAGTFSGGDVTVAGTSGGGDGISIVNSPANFIFASVRIDTSAGKGIALSGGNGDVTFTAVDIDATTGRGIEILGATNDVTIGGGTIGATTPATGFSVYIGNQAATSTISLGTLAVTASGADALAIDNSAGAIIMTGGSLSQTGGSDAIDINGGGATITIGAAISNSGIGAVAQAVEIDGTSGNITLSGNITATGGAQLFNIGSTTAPTAGTITFSGASLTATGGGNARIGGLGSGATVNATTALSITGATANGLSIGNVAGTATFGAVTVGSAGTGGISLSGNTGTVTFGATSVNGASTGILVNNNSATTSFGATTLLNVGLNQTGVSVSGTNAGTVSFASLGIGLTDTGATGISFAGAAINGNITATDFDLTATSATGTTAVNLSGTTGTGTIRLGDPGASSNATAATIAGAGGNLVGPGIAFQFSNTTAVNFIYGDGEGIVDKLSTVTAVDIFNAPGNLFPTAGNYNFLDVDGANGGFNGDTSEASGPSTYYVDRDGNGDGSAANPGSIANAELSGRDVIVLIDTTIDNISDLISMMAAPHVSGNNTLNLASGQILIGLKAGDSIDTAPLGGVGGILGSPPFQFSGINASTVINAPAGVDNVLPTLTTAVGNTIDLGAVGRIQNVRIANTGSGAGVFGSGVTDVIIRGGTDALPLARSFIGGGAGGGISLANAADAIVALSDLELKSSVGNILTLNDAAGGGVMTVWEFANLKLDGTGGETGGIGVFNARFDSTPGTPLTADAVLGGTLEAGTAANPIAAYGAWFDEITGKLTFDSIVAASNTGLNATLGTNSSTALLIALSGTGTEFTVANTTNLSSAGTGASVAWSAGLFSQIRAGNTLRFNGTVTANTTDAIGLHSDNAGTLSFVATNNTVTASGSALTGLPAISFANSVVVDNGSGGAAQFGAISASGGLNGIYLSNIVSPGMIFNGPVTISDTTSTAILMDGSESVTFNGAVNITNATQGGVSWKPSANTDTLTFTSALNIQNTNGVGFFANRGVIVATGGGTIATTGASASLNLTNNGAGTTIAIGAGGFSLTGVTANGAGTAISLNNVGGPGAINLGTVNLQGITSRGVDVAGTLGAALNFTSLNIGLAVNAIGLDLAGATINAAITANDFDVNGGGNAGTLGIDMTATAGAGVIRLGDLTNNNPGPGGQTSTILNVARGVLLSSATNANLVFGDGQAPAESRIETFGNGRVIDSGGALPALGSYDFDDVNFVGDISNLASISVYYITFDGTGDGSFANPGSVAGAEASSANVFVLIDKTTGGQETINLGAGSFDLKDGQVIISFALNDAAIDVSQLGIDPGAGAPSSFSFTTIQNSPIVAAPTGIDTLRPFLSSTNALGTILLPTAGTGTITAGVGRVLVQNTGTGAGIAVNAITGISNFFIRNNDISGGGRGLDFATTGLGANGLLAFVDGNTLSSSGSGLAASFAGQNIDATQNSIAIRSFAGNAVTSGTLGTGGGVQFTNVRFDANGAGGTVNAGTLTVGATGARVQGNGISLLSTSGTLDLGTFTVANNAGTGLLVDAKGPPATTFTLNNSGGSVDTTNGAAINLDPLTVNMTLSSVTSTGGVSGIIFDTVAGTFTVTGATSITGTSGAGISAINTNTGTFNFNGAVTINNAATAGGGIGWASGTLNVAGLANIDTTSGAGVSQGGGTTSFTGGLAIDTTTGTALAGTAGTMAISATGGGETVNSTAGQALSLSGMVANIALDSTTSAGGANNVNLSNVTGSIILGTGTLSGATGTSFNVSGGTVSASYSGGITQATAGQALVSVSGGHSSGTITFDTGTLNATDGIGLQFNDADGTYNFNGITLLNGGDAGIDIVNASSGTFTFGANTSITHAAAGDAFTLSGSSATATYSGSITDNNGRAVNIISQTGGAITFQTGAITSSGASALGIRVANSNAGTVNFNGQTTLATQGNTAVELSSNTGATVNFSNGGLDIVTTSGTGFSATGGGTLSVTGPGNNTIATNTGIAVNLDGMIIGAGNATFATIDVDGAAVGVQLTNVSGGAFTVRGGTIQNTTMAAIGITGGSSNVGFVDATISNASGRSVQIANRTGGSVSFSNVSVTDTGSGMLFSGNSGGTISFSGTGTRSINVAGANNGLTVVNSAGNSLSFSGIATIQATGSGNAVDISGGATLAFAGSAISATGTGTAFQADGGGTLVVIGTGALSAGASAMAVNLSGVAIGASGVTFASTNKAAGGTSAVVLNTVTGTGTTVALGGGSLGGGSAATLQIGDGVGGASTGGTAGLTYSGSIASGTGRAVDIQDRAATAGNITLSGNVTHAAAGVAGILLADNVAGTITFSGNLTTGTVGTPVASTAISASGNGGTTVINFSGASKSFFTSTATAVNLAGNTGATFNFTGGGLAITTTSGNGFSATGGGAVTVTGTGNSISSGTGTALNVANTTIGAAGLTFQQISSNGASSGIVLTNTGALGGLTVTGDGGGANNGSGGTIQNSTGDGISLTNTAQVRLSYMNITNNLGDGIGGSGVNGFLLTRANISGNGNDAATDESGINIAELTGSAFGGANATGIINSVISNNNEFEVQITNTTGTLTDFRLTTNTISSNGLPINGNASSPHGNLVNFLALGTANMTLNATGGSYTGNWNPASPPATIVATGIQADHSGSSGTVTANVSGASFTNLNVGPQVSNANGGNIVFNFSGNTITGTRSSSINVFTAGGPTTGSVVGTIANNTIGTLGVTGSGASLGNPIRIQNEGATNQTILIQNNIIQESASFAGININIGLSGSATFGGTQNYTILDNVIREIDNNRAIIINQNQESPATPGPTTFVNISGNSFSNIAGQVGDGSVIRLRESTGGTFRVTQKEATAAADPGELDDANGFNDPTKIFISGAGVISYNQGTPPLP